MEFDSTFASINAFGGVDYAPHNKGVTPIFFVESVLDHGATEREGRQVYVDKERVRLYVAGDPLSAPANPLDETMKARFRDQYDAWKRKESGVHIVGMPLKKWPMAMPSLIRELESLNIFSVEDLAAVSDFNTQNISDGKAWREKAAAWLASATDGAAVMRYAAEATRLREEVAELKKLIQSLGGDSKKEPHKKSSWSTERRAKQAATIARRQELDEPREE